MECNTYNMMLTMYNVIINIYEPEEKKDRMLLESKIK